MKLGMLVGLGSGHTVLDGDKAPPRKGAQQPPHSKFTGASFECVRIIRGPCIGACCSQTKMKFVTEVGIVLRQIVLNENPAPSPKGAHPQIFDHVSCGQTAGWIKMQLGTEVGLGPGHIVLDCDPAPPQLGTAPIFGPYVL